MSFDFSKLLKEGSDAAETVIKNKNEIKAVFDDLEYSISQFLSIDIYFREVTELEEVDTRLEQMKMAAFPIAMQPSNRRKPTGFMQLFLTTHLTAVEELFIKVKYSENGYPVTVVDGKARYIAHTQNELFETLGYVASNPNNHIMFKSFKNEYHRLQK
ncbi:hypothetical protein C0W92_00070 [Photobacterium angustum]|uniref:hypothetical protein n=1 Tax=Photobacterium angustum TaxID=661 RepID=UPI0005EA18A4|nr:hypothetical protein [Photobacterium angustum]KJG29179.1 hypothetical protein UA69_15065 [Photobacterium angustum]PSW91429.1 hypothetical protein C0W92_00070 [Photobacterium angustum]